jgi:phage-related baseplate assembly protein
MQLNLKSFSQLVDDMGAALQGAATSLVDVSVGSVIRAIFEANAGVVLWLQWLLLQVLSMTRAATSTGSDLDSWMADFGVTRLSATAATGIITFSRFTATVSAFIPVGTNVKTADGTLAFAVVADTALSTWSQSLSGYNIPSGVASADIPATCLTLGSAGNVLPGTITVIASSLPGVDQVTNANAFTNGTDAETDQALRARFQNYLASLSRATKTALRTAISNVQQGLLFLISENINPDGSTRIGSFLVVVDDGSGYPPSTLLSSVATAVDNVRPIGTTFAVIPPAVLTINVSLEVVISAKTNPLNLSSLIEQGIAVYLNTRPIEHAASITRVAQSAYAASSAILNIKNVTLNTGTSDVVPPERTVVKAGQITVAIDAG